MARCRCREACSRELKKGDLVFEVKPFEEPGYPRLVLLEHVANEGWSNTVHEAKVAALEAEVAALKKSLGA